ncbi:Brp/Blh family beta-carotene 15,15'-dioxygenase [Winogradskyella sp. UBA3174]|mgnify:CR=1 FL=1|uniref:Brp/Blh family beta-carotene 15,15'-dioxygenase n=1 Tax=Winogradskyella sp. UBA3174 TaxID=1947785 RepID=UPI0025EB1118|nr:Brp/Blh family beta-carotene 15,15'-dioxygenase [Winogradskyella sp. UBA3174]|tara:strand:- start:125 stop:1024 length:900 start_codon:yes stop_codon:yes gene_type:complete
MQKINNISIILSFIGLYVTSYFSGELEVLIGFFFIFSFGILHGSNDILLIESLLDKTVKHTFQKIIILYLLIVLVAIMVFYYLPSIALILFILFSAFHFGEQHWEHQNLAIKKNKSNLFYFIYGSFVLFLLFMLNRKEVLEVVASITKYNLNESTITYGFVTSSVALGISIIALIIKQKTIRTQIIKELFFLLIFAIIFKVSTLIWGFTIYFVFWHSIPSLFEQVSFIYGDYNKTNILKYCKNAFPYWLISLFGIGFVYYVFKDENIFYAVFFSFIAAVTFPHSIAINKMFKHKKTQPN